MDWQPRSLPMEIKNHRVSAYSIQEATGYIPFALGHFPKSEYGRILHQPCCDTI
jgi:hypothetical protein